MNTLPSLYDLELENARLRTANRRLASLVRQWLALDAGAWNHVRHAREKEELIAVSGAVIAEVEGRP